EAIVFIQIKHGVFDCKVLNQKRHVKVGLFRMVTLKGSVTNTKLSDEEVMLGMDDEQAELYRLVENWVTRDLGNA
ncbi:MAG: hypothetical protein U0L43_00225, partial [Muribaculaceae bacterium]|nr:hypothetical protein [Muribaculaceae bacterium]